MTTKKVLIRVVDNGYVVIWDDIVDGDSESHEEIIDTRPNLRVKLQELFADV